VAVNYDHANDVISVSDSSSGDDLTIASNFGFKNRLINGTFLISQRGNAAQTVTASNAVPTALTGYYLDRWFTYCLGADVTIQGTLISSSFYSAYITGAASVTEVGIGQRIESFNCRDLAGQTVTLSFIVANTLLTTAEVSIWHANTQDTFGTIATPTKTQIISASVATSSSLTRYQTVFVAPAGAANGIEVLFKVGAQTSGILAISQVQLELGNTSTLYETRSYNYELFLCHRYMERFSGGFYRTGFNTGAAAANNYGNIPMKVAKQITTGGWAGTFTQTNVTSVGLGFSLNNAYFGVTSTTANVVWTLVPLTVLYIYSEIL